MGEEDAGGLAVATADHGAAKRAFDQWFQTAFAGKAEYRLLAVVNDEGMVALEVDPECEVLFDSTTQTLPEWLQEELSKHGAADTHAFRRDLAR